MDADAAAQIIQDWAAASDETLNPRLQAVANALFLEETFGIVLRDDDLEPDVIGSVSGMRTVLARRSD